MRIFSGVLFISQLIFCGAALTQNRPPPPQNASDLYFISVGIGEYQQGTENAQRHLVSAEISAKLVSQALLKSGARYGIQVTSRLSEGQRGYQVTRKDLTTAITDLKRKMRRDGASAPRVVVYIMGHGYGDPKFDLLFVQPGDVDVGDSSRSQLGVSSLVQATLWNGDLLSAAVNFRTHPSMYYLDDFFPSQIMPDLTRPLSGLNTALRAQQLQDLEQRAAREIGFPEEGNPPVPFVVLFDNCFNQIEEDIVVDAQFFGGLIQGLWDQIISDGLVFYAAQPGKSETDLSIPDWIEGASPSEEMGPLGAMLIKVLQEREFDNFLEFQKAMEAGFSEPTHPDWKPYSRSNRLVNDVANSQLLPDGAVAGEVDVRYGSN